MKIKTKLVSIIAAAALSLSMAAGVAADSEVDGSLTLDGGTCSVNVTSGSFDFGALEWTGSGWEYSTGISNSVEVEIVPGWTAPGETSDCAFSLSSSGLTNGTDTFSQQYFYSGARSGMQLFPAGPLPMSFNLPSGDATITMRLYHPAPNSFSPGEYTGTFTFTVDDGQ